MTYISLYRKWRPQRFSQLVGQDHVAGTLANSIKRDRVGHAYLFAGPRGTGKTSAAKILAAAVNCAKGPTPEPCGKCESCRSIASGTSLDVIEMDAASNRGIDEIRELRDRVLLAAAAGSKKVYIIDEVHMLTEHAFNALLKTLEEPPGHVIFVLATTDPNKVPVTISSRCQHFEFRPIRAPELAGRVTEIAKSEKINLTKEAAAIITRQAEGSLRDAIGLLDQLSTYTDKTVTAEAAIKFLGLVDAGTIEAGVDLLISGRSEDVFDYVDSLVSAGSDLRLFVGATLAYLRDVYIVTQVRKGERLRVLIGPDDELVKRLDKQAKKLGPARIRSFLLELERLYEKLRFTAAPRLALELALINMMTGKELTIDALDARIKLLENQVPGNSETARIPAEREPDVTEEETEEGEPRKKHPRRSKKQVETGREGGFDKINQNWDQVLLEAKKRKLSLYAFLIEATPAQVAQDKLMLSFGPKSAFACQEMAKEPNVKALQDIVEKELGLSISVSTALEEKERGSGRRDPVAEDKNEKNVEAEESTDSTVLDLVKESFGAEIVDESAVDR